MTTACWCPTHGTVEAQIAANPNVVTAHCSVCFQMVGVQLAPDSVLPIAEPADVYAALVSRVA